MSRWRSDARERLEVAALELFAERGFEDVTVPDITERAGLTTRTFFRHFADKREVLFSDSDQMPRLVHDMVTDAPPGLTPIDVIARGLPAIASVFDGHYDDLVLRKAIIDASIGLRERELHKMELTVNAMANGFCERGVDGASAILLAETAVAVVKASLRSWFADQGRLPLETILVTSFARVGEIFGSPAEVLRHTHN